MPTLTRLRVSQLNDIVLHVFQSYKHCPNFTGADWGYRWVNGRPTQDITVRVHVKKKRSHCAVPADEIFGPTLCGLHLDVIEAPYELPALETSPGSCASGAHLMGGMACPAPAGRPGSIAMIVMDNTSDRPAILSNWHVLVGENSPNAALTKDLLSADGDAAISILPPDASWLPIQALGLTATQAVRHATLGEILTSNHPSTEGARARVDGIGLYRIPYEIQPGVFELIDMAGFRLAQITANSASGTGCESGSGTLYIRPESRDATGLHVAGHKGVNFAPDISIACQLPQIMNRLNIRPATFEDWLSFEQEKAIKTQADQMDGAANPHVYTDPSLPPKEEEYMPWCCFDTSLVVPVEAVKATSDESWIDPRNRAQSPEQRQAICLADPRDVNPPVRPLPVFESVLSGAEPTVETRNIVAEFWPELTQLL